MKKIYRVATLLMILFALGSNSLNAQQVDYKYHSLFIYNFTRYIKWPDAAIKEEFIIGVVGNSGIKEHLEKMAETRTVLGTPIVVKTFNSPTDITDCHLLFLPENLSSKFAEVQNRLAGKHTLLVSEKPGLGERGSDINFIIRNGRWNFEINQASTDKRQLKISTELTKFAEKIYTKI